MRRGTSSGLGNAVLGAQMIFQPQIREVLEVRLDERGEAGESGDPPEPGMEGWGPELAADDRREQGRIRWFEPETGRGQIESEEFYDILWVSMNTCAQANPWRLWSCARANKWSTGGGCDREPGDPSWWLSMSSPSRLSAGNPRSDDVATPVSPDHPLRRTRGHGTGAAESDRCRDPAGAGAGHLRQVRHRRAHAAGDRRNRPDILNTKAGEAPRRYDRPLTLEVWYPASLGPGQNAGGDYRAITRDPAVTATLHGQAVRDAAPLTSRAAFPLVIISHGYPGNRYLMSHLVRKPRQQGLRRRLDRSQGQHLRRPEAICEHALQPRPRPAVRTQRDRAARQARLGQLSERPRRRRAGPGSSATRWAATACVNVIGGGYSKASETLAGAPPNRLLAERGAVEPGVPEDDRPADQGRDRDRAVGHAGRILGRRRARRASRRRCCSSPAASTMWPGTRRGRGRSIRRAVNADRYLLTFVNAESQRRRADSGAGRDIRDAERAEAVGRSRTTPTPCGTRCA